MIDEATANVDHRYTMLQKGLGLWHLTPLHQYFSYIMAVSFIDGEKLRKPQNCHKSLVNFIT